jgi:hypothetical protein
MPVMKYFVVVGLALISLLFVADALFSRPKNPVYAAKFDRAQPVAPRGAAIMSRDLALPAPPIATVPTEPALPASTAPADRKDAAKPAPAKSETDTATAKEHPAKKRHRMAQRSKSRVARDLDRADRWERPGRRQQTPWDDTFAFAPQNKGPFWFR